ncbi:MAG: peptidoglycan-binding protein [Christensenellales bacterium]
MRARLPQRRSFRNLRNRMIGVAALLLVMLVVSGFGPKLQQPTYREIPACDVLIQAGEWNRHVERLQMQLKSAGHYPYDSIDGRLGQVTLNALASFQRENDLEETAACDVPTVRALFGSEADAYIQSVKADCNESGKCEKNPMSEGAVGEAVLSLQSRLKQLGFYALEPTGYFGTDTSAAIKDFQKANGLEATGIADELTAGEIFSDESVITKADFDVRLAQLSAEGEAYEDPYTVMATAGDAAEADGEQPEDEPQQSQEPEQRQADEPAEPSQGVKTYRNGDEDPRVAQIQQRLKELGYFTHGQITQHYGSITETALRAFQSANSLTANGVADKATQDKLFSSSAKKYVAPQQNNSEPQNNEPDEQPKPEKKVDKNNLTLGDEHARVAEVQQRLKALGYFTHNQITEYYGSITQAAVKKFQSANGLKANGVADKATQDKLFSDSAVKYTPPKEPDPPPSNESLGQQIVDYAKTFLGVPYRYGGMSTSGFDCSGLVSYVYKHFGYSLPRTSAGMATYSSTHIKKSNLAIGDIVCFDADHNGKADHVGIYVGGGNYIEANSGASYQVKITSLGSTWAANAFIWGIRVL